MNLVLSVAKKELRGFFSSPVAFIFVGVFLVVTLATFFTYEQFLRGTWPTSGRSSPGCRCS